MSRSSLLLSTAALALGASPAVAGSLDVSIDVPKMNTAEYHRPYLSFWLQKADGQAAGTLQVWYETGREEHGRKYLKELTSWWRKVGREMSFPADGISGATRAPGPQKVSFDTASGVFKGLAPGEYQLVVEASREGGGHETVKAPLSWPPKAGASASAKGERELGEVRLKVR
ncbi:DUF2271 domain-containing protein [soil metagenome]